MLKEIKREEAFLEIDGECEYTMGEIKEIISNE